MATHDLTKPYHGRVMGLNSIKVLSAEERRADQRYALFLVMTMMIMPLVVLVAAAVLGHVAIGLFLAALSCGVGLAVGLSKRRRIITDFFKVTDVERRVKVREMHDPWELEEALRMRALAFVATQDASWLCFVYNWLANRTVLRDKENLKAYWLPGELLVSYLESDVIPNRDFLLVPAAEFHVMPEGAGRFESELRFVGGIWLDDLVRLVQEGGESGLSVMDQELLTGLQANKSQLS